MIIDERMSAFIDSLDSGNPAWLNEIEKFALETQVPIIRRSMQSLLKFLLKFTKPKSILEVGTAIGFSALLMSEYAPGDCHITTIEKYEKRIPIAKENFRKAGREDRITLLEGDATEILRELEGTYDVIFMDPPYSKGLERRVLEVLSTKKFTTDTLIVVEAALDEDFSYVDALGFEITKDKHYKTNKHVFLMQKENV